MKHTAIAAAALLFAAAGPANCQTEAVERLRAAATEVAGFALGGRAAGMLSGIPDPPTVAIHPPTNQVLIFGHSGVAEDWGLLTVNPAGDVLSVHYASGRRIAVSPDALARAIESAPPSGERIPAAGCLDRVTGFGGTVVAGIGPLRPGWRLATGRSGGAIRSGTGEVGTWAVRGPALELQLDGRTESLPCLEVAGSLSAPPPSAIEDARDLVSLIQVLEDGNTALDRLAEYQRRLTELARSSSADALLARNDVSECRRLATLAVICDRLVATYLQP